MKKILSLVATTVAVVGAVIITVLHLDFAERLIKESEEK